MTMSRHLSPYINFQGRAREGMEFYQQAFGGKLDLQTMDLKGAPKPAGPEDRIQARDAAAPSGASLTVCMDHRHHGSPHGGYHRLHPAR